MADPPSLDDTLAAASAGDPASQPTARARPVAAIGSEQTVLGSAPSGGHAIQDDVWPAGHRVGRYVVRGRLGRGGMGTVYRADDTELARPVALKRLHASADADTRARLTREARAAAQLAHPNVVTVYEVGDDAGTPFIAMELLVDGVTLTAWLAESVRPWREVTAMLAQAGRGLAEAHARGLVHRDFKPDNVLVDRAGRARVADFGLARAGDDLAIATPTRETARAGLGRLTETGALAGTPAYLAPELVGGEPPDPRSDQFAFAIALYEGLQGQHPFAGTTAAALWAAMAAGEIRPGKRSLPAWLDRHVRRGLAADPAHRWPDIASFVAAIEAPARRRAWPYVALAVGVAIAGASSPYAIRALRGAPDRCATAGSPIAGVWPAHRAKVAAVLAASPLRDGTLGALDAFADRWRDASVTACRVGRAGELSDARTACLDRARIRAEALIEDLEGGGSDALAGAAAAADELPELAPCADLDQLSSHAIPTSKKDRDALAIAEHDLARANLLRDRGDLDGADQQLDAARAIASPISASDVDTRAWLLTCEIDRDRGDPAARQRDAINAALSATASGQRDLALTAQFEAMSAAAGESRAEDRFPAIPDDMSASPRDAAPLYAALGKAEEAGGHYKEALAAFRRAQELRAKVLPPEHVERLVGDFEIAGALVMLRQDAEALPILQRVRAGFDQRVAPLRREAIDTLHAIGMAEAHAGHADAAIAADREVLARRAKLFGEHAPMCAIARDELASALDSGGYRADAAAAREVAIADELAAMGEKSVNVAEARVNLSTDYIALGRYADALAALAIARPLLVSARGAEHVDVAIADLAIAHARAERALAAHAHVPADFAEVDALLDHVAQVFTGSFGESSQPMAAVLEVRGLAAAARADWAAADRAYTSALAAAGAALAPADRADMELEHADALAHVGRAADARTSAAAAAADYSAAGPGFAGRVAAARAWHP